MLSFRGQGNHGVARRKDHSGPATDLRAEDDIEGSDDNEDLGDKAALDGKMTDAKD